VNVAAQSWTGVQLTQNQASGNVSLYSGDNVPMIFSNNAAEHMRITAAGNVGIGTTSPGYLLTVNGTGSFTGTLLANGGTVLSSVTNLSNSVVTATGSTTARTLGARAFDLPNFADSGAVGDGVADDAPAINAWLAAVAAAKGVSLVIMDQRQYLIDSVDLTIPQGISIVGPWLGGRGENAVTYDYTAIPASFILNTAHTIMMAHSTAITGCCVRRKGLLPGSSVANLVANQLGKAGTGITNTSGTTDAASNVLIERNLILGFARAIDSFNNSRAKIKDNQFDCTNGIRVQACYDWDEISGNEGWPFLTGHNPLFNSLCIIPITSSSIVGGLRRFVTTTPHGFVTGWPILITTTHIGAGVGPCYGVSPITVINATTFDLNTASGLTTATLGLPSGPGTGAGAGGSAVVAIPINYGVAYECDAVMDWGMWHNNNSWGWAIGTIVNGCDNVTYVNCGADNFSTSGFWGAIGFQAINASASPTWIGCQVAAHQTGWSMATSGASQGNSGMMLGCTGWTNNGAVIDLQAGSLEVVGCKFDISAAPNGFINVGASGGVLELIGVKGALPIVNASANPVRIKGGDYGIDTQTLSAISGAGTTQATATPVTTQFSNVVVVGVNSGVILPSTAPIGSRVTVLNATATTLNVYPFVGSQIGGLAVNAAAALAGSTSANYMLVSATVWQIA